MRIGIFTDTYFPQISGVSTSIQTLTEELRRLGHEVFIFTTTDPEAKPDPKIIRLPSVPFMYFKDRRIAVRGMDHALRLARSFELDLIHTQTEFSLGLLGLYIANRLSIPVIHTYHTMYEKYTHYILDGELILPEHVRKLSNLFCSQVNAMIVPSQHTKETLRSYGITVPISVVSTGVSMPSYDHEKRDRLRRQLNFNDDDIVLLSLSRLSEEKGIEHLINQFDEIVKHLPTAKLVIVGDGPDRPRLESLAKLQSNAFNIYFVGQIEYDQVHKYYQMADVYVNASNSETQGLTYLEALVNRLPVVALSNDYLAEIIDRNEKYGLLFEKYEDYPITLVKFLNQRHEDWTMDEADLYPLSSQKFGKEVARIYEQLIQTYPTIKRGIFGQTKSRLANLVRQIVLGDTE